MQSPKTRHGPCSSTQSYLYVVIFASLQVHNGVRSSPLFALGECRQGQVYIQAPPHPGSTVPCYSELFKFTPERVVGGVEPGQSEGVGSGRHLQIRDLPRSCRKYIPNVLCVNLA